VSFNKTSSNAQFRKKESFGYPLWSDLDRELGLYYGAAKSKTTFLASRITVVLDPQGTWKLLYPSKVVSKDLYNHGAIVLNDLKVLLGKP
jgi:peroxiredoxin